MNNINQHIANTKIAMKYWATVPDENVVAGLESFTNDDSVGKPFSCNTIACFGGCVPAMPEFAAMGVKITCTGIPIWGDVFGDEVAIALFGDYSLFNWRGNYENKNLNDKQLVSLRLTNHLKSLLTKKKLINDKV